jgi:hypothetical protein
MSRWGPSRSSIKFKTSPLGQFVGSIQIGLAQNPWSVGHEDIGMHGPWSWQVVWCLGIELSEESFPGPSTRRSVWLPYWLLTALMLILPAFQLRRRLREQRKVKQGRCSSCGYDLTGNRSGICPECGRALPLTEHIPS